MRTRKPDILQECLPSITVFLPEANYEDMECPDLNGYNHLGMTTELSFRERDERLRSGAETKFPE